MSDNYSLVDKLVLIDAEIKKLKKRQKELKEQVIALGEGGHPGHHGAVTVSLQNRKSFKAEMVLYVTDKHDLSLSSYENAEVFSNYAEAEEVEARADKVLSKQGWYVDIVTEGDEE